MKVRITDLLDLYAGEDIMLAPMDAQLTDSHDQREETIPLKERKHQFGWKEGLAVAAAAAVVVLGGFGLNKLLNRDIRPVPATNSPTVQASESITPIDTSQDAPVDTDSTTDLLLALQGKANTYLTYFAEQGITQYSAESVQPYDLVSFAHLYYKINEPGAIVYQGLDGESYETLTLEQVSSLLEEKLGIKDFDLPNDTDFTEQRGDNYALHEFYRDKTFWFPAADGDQHNAFAICEAIRDPSDGTLTLEYRVYDPVSPELWDIMDKTAAIGLMTVQEAEQDDRLELIMSGSATVRIDPDQDDRFYLLSLNASYDKEPLATDPDGLAAEAALSEEDRLQVNRFLSFFSEQYIFETEEALQDEWSLVHFAHTYYKLHDANAMELGPLYPDGEAYYESLSLEQVNAILTRFLGKSVSPVEDTDYTALLGHNSTQHYMFREGRFWFAPVDGGNATCFSLCESVYSEDETELRIRFRVYDGGLDIYDAYLPEQLLALTVTEADDLVAAGSLEQYLVGNAVLRKTDSGLQMVRSDMELNQLEGWEEEYPQEYPVTDYRIEGQGFQQSGEIYLYRYAQLPEAEHYVDILTGIAREALNLQDASFVEDSPHDGYANWFMTDSSGHASVSGSSVTGRFIYNLYPSFQRILAQSEATITDRDAMQAAARSFAEAFSGITGELELVGARDEEQYYHDERFSGLRDITVPAVIYYFRSAENSRKTVSAQNGLSVPITCGDSTLDSLSDHTFAVTVWPDGTVVSGSNYITRAEIVSDGSIDMPDASYMDRILSFMTSLTENDTLVLESAALEEYSVYFGHAEIDPVLTIRYHFASNPNEHQSTMIVIPGLLD